MEPQIFELWNLARLCPSWVWAEAGWEGWGPDLRGSCWPCWCRGRRGPNQPLRLEPRSRVALGAAFWKRRVLEVLATWRTL